MRLVKFQSPWQSGNMKQIWQSENTIILHFAGLTLAVSLSYFYFYFKVKLKLFLKILRGSHSSLFYTTLHGTRHHGDYNRGIKAVPVSSCRNSYTDFLWLWSGWREGFEWVRGLALVWFSWGWQKLHTKINSAGSGGIGVGKPEPTLRVR